MSEDTYSSHMYLYGSCLFTVRLIPAAGRMKNGALQTVQQDASCIIHCNGSLEQLLLLEAGAVAATGGYGWPE